MKEPGLLREVTEPVLEQRIVSEPIMLGYTENPAETILPLFLILL
jgi:hypothetical protein